MNVGDLIGDILRREGGFVNNDDDRGGATNYGITQDTLAQWRGKPVSVDDVRNLTRNEASEIYTARYYFQPKFDLIDNDDLAALVVDCGVNHGVSRAARWLQDATNDVVVDGMVGPITIEAVNSRSPGYLYRVILATRCRFYGRLITNDPTQATFAAGWANRVAEFIQDTP